MEKRIPKHVAVIMDGNGRWAKNRLLPRSAGHRAGMKRMISLSEHIFDCGVEWCTLYALSTENLNRPQEELDALFGKEKKITLRVIGNLQLLPDDVREVIGRGEEETKGGARGTLVLAIAYGARQEILSAVNSAVRAGMEVTEESFSALLSTEGIPDPDLLIRTGKEVRLSNFLLWQSAYAEFYVTDVLWPDFSKEDFLRALAAYQGRSRRYGGV